MAATDADSQALQEVCLSMLAHLIVFPDSSFPSQRLMQPSTEQKLKSALWYHVGRIVDEETINLGVNATPQFIGTLTELVWAQLSNAAIDLESFANHAGRNTVKTDDVLLLARRNEGLETLLKQRAEKIRKEKEKERAKGKGK